MTTMYYRGYFQQLGDEELAKATSDLDRLMKSMGDPVWLGLDADCTVRGIAGACREALDLAIAEQRARLSVRYVLAVAKHKSRSA